MTTDAINNVPRELIDSLINGFEMLVHDSRVPNEVSQECAAVLIEARKIMTILLATAQPAADGEHVPGEVFQGEFQAWWEEHGQYCRAGGGDYERAFAFQAWRHLYPMLMRARAALSSPSHGEQVLADAERFKKLLGWMSSNVTEGWNEVCRVSAVATYVSHDEARAYLDDLPQCSVGLAAAPSAGSHKEQGE